MIVYLGDGGGTSTRTSIPERVYLERTFEEVSRRNAGRAQIHAFGFEPIHELFLRQLAKRNGGTYTRVTIAQTASRRPTEPVRSP